MSEPLDVDYLVIGAGAMGMAFSDVILTESDATVALVPADTGTTPIRTSGSISRRRSTA